MFLDSRENKENKVPMEFPATQQEKKINPIVDVVENEINPTKYASNQQTISKAPQE